ncbi:MAG: hypothetical protein ACE15E_18395 [Acidobacteriota bacterium]
MRVRERDARVFILDPESKEIVAEHVLSRTHGDIVKNFHPLSRSFAHPGRTRAANSGARGGPAGASSVRED